MSESSVIHNTFVIERSYPTSPERVFRAFADEALKRRWFAESPNHDVEEFAIDFRVGGSERAQYRFREGSPFPGVALISQGIYQDIVTNQRLVTASTMALGDRRISASLVTMEFLPTDSGTDLICTHQAVFFEGSDGPERREGGWRKLLEQLANELTPLSQSAGIDTHHARA
jgi:uncharacterized protein YndB with AHSA1/START domain